MLFEPANAPDAKEQPLELESSSEILDPDNSSIENSPAESTDLKPKPIDQEVPQPKLDDDTFAPKAPSPKPLDPFAELEDSQPKASPTKSKNDLPPPESPKPVPSAPTFNPFQNNDAIAPIDIQEKPIAPPSPPPAPDNPAPPAPTFNPFEGGDAPKTEDGPPAEQPSGLVPPPPPPAPPAPTFNPFEDGDAPKTEDGPPAEQPSGLVPLLLLRLLQHQPLILSRTEMLRK